MIVRIEIEYEVENRYKPTSDKAEFEFLDGEYKALKHILGPTPFSNFELMDAEILYDE